LNVVDLPTFGNPTIPILRVVPGFPHKVGSSSLISFLGGMMIIIIRYYIYIFVLSLLLWFDSYYYIVYINIRHEDCSISSISNHYQQSIEKETTVCIVDIFPKR